ncbi:DNA-binding transcription factor ACE2 NDAI_0G02560 [Naumovozyma dairenensis CBS 421]|uniref:C2H2-type domain-containing protein n=1 Tax=Naumovozyma dairenensis (strain ATCC 10597 / BCRC 20456 / CBS 421 / NBRC 0211 / NRRL Y-12639) TaxID=1071378 RepID=G0WE22_NAUDC|nr:hypothetical protein NDAI_0G02560 [Naumovozyma dairenensis CBS 421]CCD26033.2 hypothetical protein NDAI_0G02560 [Naumovozyma dairenensis CBS 421]
MESVPNSSWLMDPSDVLKNANIIPATESTSNTQNTHNMNGSYARDMDNIIGPNNIYYQQPYLIKSSTNSCNNNNNNNDNTNAPLFEDQDNFDSLFDLNYTDIDSLLTQELKDLDIPLIPTDNNNSSNDSNQWNNHQYGKKSMSHKRGPSGTAIFGFLNHNKNLSISSVNRHILELSKDPTSFDINFLQNNSNNTIQEVPNENPATNHLSQSLLKQQEKLRLALEQQKEVNKKLELQLKENQLQQEKLQRVLLEQEAVAQQLVSKNTNNDPYETNNDDAFIITTPPPKINLNPSSNNNNSNNKYSNNNNNIRNDELIITTNSTNGKYQFPPPIMISPANSNSNSNSSMNASPTRRGRGHNRRFILSEVSDNGNIEDESFRATKDGGNNDNFSTNTPDLLATTNYFQELSKQRDCYPPVSSTKLAPSAVIAPPLNSPFYIQSPGKESNDTLQEKSSFLNPFTANTQYSSSSPSEPATSRTILSLHSKKDSCLSTVSTIPQTLDEALINSQGIEHDNQKRLLGLGLNMALESTTTEQQQQQQRRDSIRKPPPLNILPTIPGSSNNTPIKKNKNQFPQKHTFQHTPIKTLTPMRTHNNAISPTASNLEAPLPPPPTLPLSLLSTPTPPRSQTIRTTSPTRITKKPTTLPPGTIDQYVEELPNKQFGCLYPNCDKIFKRRYNVRTHIQTHLEDRPYRCEFRGCEKAFVRNHDLVRHKKLHAEKHMKTQSPIKKKNAIEEERSPVKETIERDKDKGIVVMKIQEQLREEQEGHESSSTLAQEPTITRVCSDDSMTSMWVD